MKKPALIRIVIDSREQDLSWVNKFKFDKKFSSEKIKILDYIVCNPFKCLDCDGKKIKTSIGDIGYQYSLDGGITWCDTNLSIELKKGEDFSSTLYSSYKRFEQELKRAIEYKLDFYIVYNQSTKEMHEHFNKLKYMKKINMYSNPHKVIYDRMLEICDLKIPLIYTHEIHEVIKRIIKYHIKKYKIQYK